MWRSINVLLVSGAAVDSGSGGLKVVRQVAESLPEYEFVFRTDIKGYQDFDQGG